MIEQIGAYLSSIRVTDTFLSLLISTGILLVSILVLRAVSARFIRRAVLAPELRRKWIVQTRNGLILLMLMGLVMIWGEELRTLALSIVAIAVAFVVATKELILCLTGSLLKSGARSFQIGDRIQVKDFRGDVIDQNLLATTILEVGPGRLTHQRTGRMTIIPNALFVSEPVINESYTHDYVIHVFTVPFKREDNWRGAQQALMASAEKHCQPYLDKARKHMTRLTEHRGFDIPTVDPRVSIQLPTASELHLIVRIPARSGERSFIEQTILAEVFGENDFTAKRQHKSEDTELE
ncbi:mechanosensitive ion channel domain-containing protein [Pseudomonas saliphila]|uniref:mechanosensitive ion channel domain-containing protein n=1 Tax=Pseudomonas saliphila TaxID=2586906 RepID=UPI00123B0E75|nr:mechanosensitive ion channel domain-containing protein [Pseudomonas saliphila]